MLDPCCGSGHFLTEALAALTALRQAEEDLSPAEAVAAVLRDNLYGLEIDGRCVQIAAFAVALTAWRIGGWQTLPLPHIAWVGAPPPLPQAEFIALANGDPDLQAGLSALHDIFIQAPILGSLLEPIGGDLVDPVRIAKIEQLLQPLIERARRAAPEQVEGVIAARGMADAVHLLSSRYTIQLTNVPFLGRGEQSSDLASIIDKKYPDSKQCLSTTMLERLFGLAEDGGSVVTVTKQEWCFLVSYTNFRRSLLDKAKLDFIVTLGEEAWEAFNKRGPLATLTSWTNRKPSVAANHFAVDATKLDKIVQKKEHIRCGSLRLLSQEQQKLNPDSRITTEAIIPGRLLSHYAHAYQGISTGDVDQLRRMFWEMQVISFPWRTFRSTVSSDLFFSGCEHIVNWGMDGSHFAALRGGDCFGKLGIAVSQMRHLPVSMYLGEAFDGNVSAIIPFDDSNLASILEFCSSAEYKSELRKIDKKKNITNATLVKVPFDLARWQGFSRQHHPKGLPEPYSCTADQWIFHGHPANANKGTCLHIALARLCGYHWPAETDKDLRLSAEAREWIDKAASLPAGDDDGLLGIPAVAGEKELADRLRAYLAAAFGADWSDPLERRLVAEADEVLDKKQARDGSLEAWLRDRAFRQHCTFFHDRPFLWQIWDGLKDGFSVFVHYHRFDQATLRKLTYTMLGDWLARAKAENNELRYEKGRVLQQTLEKILEGKEPYDIFVRWKSLADQPLGWDPDLDDGVRMNIRPFVKAGVLREQPKIKWTKDRGTDVTSAPWYSVFKGERINDHHTTLAEKKTAREPMKKRVEAAK